MDISTILIIIGVISFTVYILECVYQKNENEYNKKSNNDITTFTINFKSKDENWNIDIPLSEKLAIGQYRQKNDNWSDPKMLYWSGEKWHVFDIDINVNYDSSQKPPDRWIEVYNISLDKKE